MVLTAESRDSFGPSSFYYTGLSFTHTSRYGPNRRMLPGALGSASHLQGEVAGDAGFDPLGLAVDPASFAR